MGTSSGKPGILASLELLQNSLDPCTIRHTRRDPSGCHPMENWFWGGHADISIHIMYTKNDWRLKKVCQVPRLLQLMKSSIINHTVCRKWFRNVVLQNKWDTSSPSEYTARWNLSPWEGSQVLGKSQSEAFSVGLGPHQEDWEERCEEGTEVG